MKCTPRMLYIESLTDTQTQSETQRHGKHRDDQRRLCVLCASVFPNMRLPIVTNNNCSGLNRYQQETVRRDSFGVDL